MVTLALQACEQGSLPPHNSSPSDGNNTETVHGDISLPAWITSSQEGSQQGTVQRHGPLLCRLRERD